MFQQNFNNTNFTPNHDVSVEEVFNIDEVTSLFNNYIGVGFDELINKTIDEIHFLH